MSSHLDEVVAAVSVTSKNRIPNKLLQTALFQPPREKLHLCEERAKSYSSSREVRSQGSHGSHEVRNLGSHGSHEVRSQESHGSHEVRSLGSHGSHEVRSLGSHEIGRAHV